MKVIIVIFIIILIIIIIISQKNKKLQLQQNNSNISPSEEEKLIPKNVSTATGLCTFNTDCESGVCYNGFCVEKPHDDIACVETSCDNNIICLNNNIMIYDRKNKAFCLIDNWWKLNKIYFICEGLIKNSMFILAKDGLYINVYQDRYDLSKVYLLGENKIDDEVIKSIFVYNNILYCICNGKIFYGISQRELTSNAPVNWEPITYMAGRDITNENILNVVTKGEMIDIETKNYHLRYNKTWNKIETKGKFIPISDNRYLMIRKNKLYDYRHEDVIVYDKILDAVYDYETKHIIVITPYDVIKILQSNEIVTGKGNKLFNIENKIFLLSNDECESL